MKRLLAFLFCLIPFVAWGQSSPNWPTGYRPSSAEFNAEWAKKQDVFGGAFFAITFGMKADGVTSDDVAMKNAVDACAATGSTLYLPPGKILLTGAVTINLRNCLVVGAGSMGGVLNSAGSFGTMFLITSTSVKPFNIGSNWGFVGTNFFWPNQTTGLIVYPPLFSPATETATTQQWYLDHVALINPYDGIVTGGGAFFVTDCFIYPMRDAFRIGNIGDSVRINGVHFTPGPWFTMTNFTAPYTNVSSTNVMFHAQTGGNGAANFAAHNIGAFAIGTAIKIDPNVSVGITEANFLLDGVGTVIDASSGGTWAGAANTPFRGGAGCNDTCFKMGGANSSLFLEGFNGGAQKSFIESSGANVSLVGTTITTLGAKNDGTDYYAIHLTANGGGTTVLVKSSFIQGIPSNVHTHGIKTDVAASRLTVQDTAFVHLNEDIDAQSAGSTIINGNWSGDTAGAESIVTASMVTGGLPVAFAANAFDKPPKAVITAGFGAGATIQGGFSGIIFVGSTNPTTTGSFKLPFMISNGGACTFTPSTLATISAGQSGTPPTWNVLASGDIHGAQLYYNCVGASQQ